MSPIQNNDIQQHFEDFQKPDKSYLKIIIGWIIFGIIATIYEILQTIFIFGAIIFLFVEHRKKGWPKTIIGLKKGAFRQDMKNNWGLVLLVGCITQILSILLMVWFQPNTITHIINRIPLLGDGSINIINIITLFVMLVFSTLGEELVFRDLLQNRLGWYIPPIAANLIISIVFGILHYSPGIIAIILFDIIPIIIDSIIYGLLWERTKNITIPWVAHWMADWVGLICLIMLI